MTLFIPKKLKIGFQKRNDTYTGKLAYVMYYDEKGILRKEKSWNSWIDKRIETIEIDNIPKTGFIFNKGVQRTGYHWSGGRSVVRVYDDRDFEFEISVDNLIVILMHSDISKRDIMEECIFAWDGSELVLLPVNSEEYKESVKYTNQQLNKISTKDLVKGVRYQQKKNDIPLTYIGFFDWYQMEYVGGYYLKYQVHKGKKHVFYDELFKTFCVKSPSLLSHAISDEIVENYAELVDEFYKTPQSQKIVSYTVTKKEYNDRWSNMDFYKIVDNTIVCVHINTFSMYGEDKIRKANISFNSEAINLTDNKSVNLNGVYYDIDGLYGFMNDVKYNEQEYLSRFEVFSLAWKHGFGNLKGITENGNIIEVSQ